MPLGPYTLDGKHAYIDSQRIYSLSPAAPDAFARPHVGTAEIARTPRPAGMASADGLRSDSEAYAQAGPPSTAPGARKRAVDPESEGLHALQRPLKKAKVHEAPVLRESRRLKAAANGAPPRISFPAARKENGKVCKAATQFTRLVQCKDTTEAAQGTAHRVNRHSE